MFRFSRYIVLAIILALLLASGCTDRGTNVPVKSERDVIRSPQDNSVSPIIHDFYPEYAFQVRNSFRIMEMAVYVPRVSFPPPYGEFEKTPLLILLPPQDGDQYYFFRHGLQEIADDLIDKGLIQPMTIACITNDKVFGGYFYGGSGASPAGDYDAILGGSLIDFLYTRYSLLKSPAKTGIGGVGMGSYGAFRAALLNPDKYTSVSGTDGPLDFDGLDGNSGLIDLFDDALAEQSLDATTLKQFDTSGTWHISRMMIGGALAFSPHDTTIFWHDSVAANRLFIIVDSTYVITDSTTLVENLINFAAANFDFHLPFDGSGRPYAPIWQLWRKNNLETILAAQGPAALGGTEIYISTTPEVHFGFYDQTKSWIRTLSEPPYSYDVEVNEYTGYKGNPATHDQYLYQVLRDMLIFHSNNFGK